jgi:hypothetical protein
MAAGLSMLSPLSELVSAVLAGEVSCRAGQDRAARPEFAAVVSADEVAVLSEALADVAVSRRDEKPLHAMRVVRVASWASGDVEAAAIGSMRSLTLLHEMLSRRHDGALLAEAIEEHQRAVSLLSSRSAPAWCLGGVHSEFGRLVVDAYTLGLLQGDRRGIDERDRSLRVAAPTLAQPEELLRQAADCLEESAAAYPGPVDGDRAAALKARAEALWALETLSVPLRLGEDPVATAMAALQATPSEDVPTRAALIASLRSRGLLDTQVPGQAVLDVVARDDLSVDETFGACVDTAQAVGRTDPAAGIQLLSTTRSGLSSCSPGLREGALKVELQLLSRLAPADAGHLDAVALRQLAVGARWTDLQRGAAFVAAAIRALTTESELDGLALVAHVRAAGGDFVDTHRPALDFLEAALLHHQGVNEFRRGRWANAARWYGEALRGFLDLDLPDRAHSALLGLVDVTRHAAEDDRLPMIAALAPVVGRLEIRAGTDTSLLVQEAFRNLSAAEVTAPWNSEMSWSLRCLAKGARLASALRTGATTDVSTDPVATSLLSRVHDLDVAARGAEPNRNAVFDDVSLVAYAGYDELFKGDTSAEQLGNARRRFDTRVSEQLLRPTTVWEGLGALQAQLDDRTVVVDWYQGATPDGRAALHLLVFSRDRVEGSIIPYERDAGPVAFDLHGRTVLASSLVPDTLARRLPVQELPLDEDDLVVASAIEPLETAQGRLFGSFGAQMLERHREAGRDHLCLVPHGSLHFDPVHLCGAIGHPLADDWIVTSIPNSALLARRSRHARGVSVASVGIEAAFASHLGLSPLKDARAEALDVARWFDATPLLDEEAKPPIVLDAMRRARFVHLSTHGEQCPEAPAFHRLFLAPDDASDGSLYAYEILGSDLHGVDLVTLSACESALGRFDAADNLAGLPAALFLAGVRTIVGTMWRVSAAASKLFFTTLYQALANETGPLDAFGIAQRATRKAYPRYAQWGAFVFLGDWRWE